MEKKKSWETGVQDSFCCFSLLMFFHLVVVATENLQFVVTVDDVVILDVPIAVVESDFVAVVVLTVVVVAPLSELLLLLK